MRRPRGATRTFASRSQASLLIATIRLAAIGTAAIHGAPVAATRIGIDPVARHDRRGAAFVEPAIGRAPIRRATFIDPPTAEPQFGFPTVVASSIRRFATLRHLHVHGRAPGHTTP